MGSSEGIAQINPSTSSPVDIENREPVVGSEFVAIATQGEETEIPNLEKEIDPTMSDVLKDLKNKKTRKTKKTKGYPNKRDYWCLEEHGS